MFEPFEYIWHGPFTTFPANTIQDQRTHCINPYALSTVQFGAGSWTAWTASRSVSTMRACAYSLTSRSSTTASAISSCAFRARAEVPVTSRRKRSRESPGGR